MQMGVRGGERVRGRVRAADPLGDEFVVALEEVGRRIQDPVAKLRYLRGSIAEHEEKLFKKPGPSRGVRPTSAALVVLAISGFAAAGWYFSRPAVAAPAPAPTVAPVAEALPALPSGVKPSRIWLVEKNETSEQYSNGLRIDTTFEVAGDPRRYHVFATGTGMNGEVHDQPVGIVFHTSESDIWPLDESYNENLRTSSHNLLRYLQRNRLYNYQIDRFGRVFRVVTDATKANHAGQGVWTKGSDIYLSLNNAMLGICFETRWEGGHALPITAAQLAAGRSLTDWLRQHYDIAADMCVGHGLISVNPKKHLIGHHVDWARGFPFEAFGLPNQYARVAPSVSLFGFVYDDDFIKVMGEPWEGVRAAESALNQAATDQGKSLEALRRERQTLYDQWLEAQTKDQEQAAADRAKTPRAAEATPPNRRSGDAGQRPDASTRPRPGPQALRSGG
jgi:hypothetical protein